MAAEHAGGARDELSRFSAPAVCAKSVKVSKAKEVICLHLAVRGLWEELYIQISVWGVKDSGRAKMPRMRCLPLCEHR